MSIISIVYVILTAIMLIMIVRKKEVMIMGVAAILIIGLIYTKNPANALIVLCSAVTSGMSEILPIYIGISLIVSMTFALKKTGADRYISVVFNYLPKKHGTAYLTIGLLMMAVSFMIWPSPAVALLGALLLPAAIKAKLPPVYAASAMSLFGYGVALSGDFLIQGVPAIVAKSMGISCGEFMYYLVPPWAVMSVVTITAAFVQFIVDKKNGKAAAATPTAQEKIDYPCENRSSKLIIIATFLIFLIGTIAMITMDIKGDDATALISGIALVCTCIAGIIAYPKAEAAEHVLDFIVDGFRYAMKVFAPAIVIIGFFSMGNSEISSQVLGENAPGCITEIVSFIMDNIKVPKPLLPVFLTVIGFIYSIDGSGFAGLMVIGDIAKSFGLGTEGSILLAALGQLVIIWVGGGTLIPWSMIPVSSVCGVDPYDLAKKNIKPVLIGFSATVAAAIVMLCVKCV